MLLDGIRFMRAELGEPSGRLPESLQAAELEYAELKSKVEPPTRRQMADLSYLLKKTGGVMTGNVSSRRQAQILIEELRRVPTEQGGKAGVGAHRGNHVHGSAAKPGSSEARGEWVGRAAATGIILPWAVCMFLWFEVTIVWTLITMGIVFIVLGGLYVLGLWR